MLITIDGEDARDFDDAVYCEKQGQGWKFISRYCRCFQLCDSMDSALDRDAYERGTSVYFPQRVVPYAARGIIQWALFAQSRR